MDSLASSGALHINRLITMRMLILLELSKDLGLRPELLLLLNLCEVLISSVDD